ncbi:hypothetical protein HCN44_007973 [Aphidius gifuensis]|uniref:Cytochrome c oxidase subunit 6B1 n=1 Tax=Aphidius gifuensis TaxID=684658 RepID=A0A835CN98_APHGI|nr:hypothetical protein HCN44_007973 [Aphidius gifuensis]
MATTHPLLAEPGKLNEEQVQEILKTHKTAPYDPRFPNTNQTRNCYQNFVDFHRCKKVRGEEYEACQYFKKIYSIMCPSDWVERWTLQIEEDRFPGRI